MLANAVTLTRLLLTFAVITILGGYLTLDIALIAMIALIFIFDASVLEEWKGGTVENRT